MLSEIHFPNIFRIAGFPLQSEGIPPGFRDVDLADRNQAIIRYKQAMILFLYR